MKNSRRTLLSLEPFKICEQTWSNFVEAESDIYHELAAMKAQLSGAGPKGSQTNDTPSEVDAELEELRQQLDQM